MATADNAARGFRPARQTRRTRPARSARQTQTQAQSQTQPQARTRTRTRLGAALTAVAIVGSWTLISANPAAADEISAGEWGRAFIHAAQADQTTNGSGVTVGLLDSGVMTQRVNLSGRVTNGPDYAGGVERPGQSGWGEHGTCMASIIAGTGAGGGDMMGVAPGVHILAVRVIRDDDAPDVGGATTSSTPISDGIHYAVDHGVQVISMSIGGDAQGTDGDSSDEADAIRYALDHNVAVVIAAGNTGTEGDAISFPGADRGAITVAAVNSSGHVADFSTTGWDVDVAAPGVNITCDAPDSDEEMEIGDGTSQATAFTAGVVALIKAENKDLSPAQIRGILEQSAQDKPAGGRDDQIGFGIIDAQAAVALAAKTKATPENPATNAQVAGGHFGYGPTQVVAEAAPSFGPLQRAVAGGAVIVLGGLALAFAMLRRAKRQLNAATAGPTATIGEVFVSETVAGAIESGPAAAHGPAAGESGGPPLWVAPGAAARELVPPVPPVPPEPIVTERIELREEAVVGGEVFETFEATELIERDVPSPLPADHARGAGAETQMIPVREPVTDAVPSWVRDATQMLATAEPASAERGVEAEPGPEPEPEVETEPEPAESEPAARNIVEPTLWNAPEAQAPPPAPTHHGHGHTPAHKAAHASGRAPAPGPGPEANREADRDADRGAGPGTGPDPAPPTPPAGSGTTLDG